MQEFIIMAIVLLGAANAKTQVQENLSRPEYIRESERKEVAVDRRADQNSKIIYLQ